jgi:DnaJ like chaperone protein
MGSFTKWLGAGLGFTFGGPIGAALGFAIGSFVDGFSVSDLTEEQRAYQQSAGHNSNRDADTQSGDFEMSLLVLASIVIKADGKIDQKELDFVRAQFTGMYGKSVRTMLLNFLKGLLKKRFRQDKFVCK